MVRCVSQVLSGPPDTSRDGRSYAARPELAGIISDATAALATHNPAQINIMIRNAKTNAWEMEVRSRAAVQARGQVQTGELDFVGLNVLENPRRQQRACESALQAGAE